MSNDEIKIRLDTPEEKSSELEGREIKLLKIKPIEKSLKTLIASKSILFLYVHFQLNYLSTYTKFVFGYFFMRYRVLGISGHLFQGWQ